jgi:hypothetical protein
VQIHDKPAYEVYFKSPFKCSLQWLVKSGINIIFRHLKKELHSHYTGKRDDLYIVPCNTSTLTNYADRATAAYR